MQNEQKLPEVSIIICTHNRSELCHQAVMNVIERCPPAIIPYEVIIVDNFSTDNTKVMACQLESQFRGIVRYIYEPKLGLSNARNRGISEAKATKLIVFLDDDAQVTQGWLQGLVAVFEQHDDAVACGGRVEPLFAQYPPPSYIEGKAYEYLGKYDLGDEITPCQWIPGGNCAFRKELLLEVDGFDERLGRRGSKPTLSGEETYLLKQLIQKTGGRLYYTPKAKIYHHISPERTRIRNMCLLYYGQGRSKFTLEALEFPINRVICRNLLIISLLRVIKRAIKITFNILLLSKDKAIKDLFHACFHLGYAISAMRWESPECS